MSLDYKGRLRATELEELDSETLAWMVAETESESDQLREAIKHHQWKKWCVGYVHDLEDRKLYAALQEAGND